MSSDHTYKFSKDLMNTYSPCGPQEEMKFAVESTLQFIYWKCNILKPPGFLY